jgi:hypothetical protein
MRPSRRVLAGLVASVAASVFVIALAASAAACPSYRAPVVSGHITDDRINEASGLVATGPFKKTFWLEEDSGNGAWVYAVATTGRIRDTIAVRDAVNWDWEDIARARGRIWIGDIGANQLARDFIRVYWFNEPGSLSRRHVEAKVMVLRYPNNISHNAEAMIVDGRTQRLFIFEKQASASSSRVFGVSIRGVRSGDSLRLRKVARVPIANITAADLGKAGIVVKNYGTGMLFRWEDRRVGTTLRQPHPCAVDLPSGEAVAFSKAGGRIFTVPEGSNPPIAHADRR